MTMRTLAEIDAEIADLKVALRMRLTGKAVSEVNYANNGVKYGGVFVADYEQIRMRLAELKIERAKIAGTSSGLGPIRIGFGDRY